MKDAYNIFKGYIKKPNEMLFTGENRQEFGNASVTSVMKRSKLMRRRYVIIAVLWVPFMELRITDAI